MAVIGIAGLGLALGVARVVREVPVAAQAGEMLVYFGTYTNNEKSKGIYVSRLNLSTGQLTEPRLAAETTSPSFLAIHPDGRHLYAANEVRTFQGQQTGAVSAFAIDKASGTLTPLNQQSSGGSGPAHLIVDTSGRVVLVANYGGGSAAALPLEADGRLKPPATVVQYTGSSANPKRQTKPYAHSVNVDPANRFAYVADLGTDKIHVHKLDPAAGTLAPEGAAATVAPGSGPRHFAFHPTEPYAYVINEMLLTVTAFRHDRSSGGLTEVQTITTLPPGQATQDGYSTAEVQVHPSGRFLYGSNRGHDSITVFAIDPSSGRLTFVENEPTQGSFPRGFGIDPTGQYLLAGNQRSDTVVVFRIDQKTGHLSPTGQTLSIGAPVCVKFVQ
jgi:6-phosphogluconolactonase